ncbi:MAG: ComEC/Rec2 family competence protein [Deltaproteobacteria bacterium]|nr:ComEC/Rec2 family competence protein [Candidatus Tharpella aukensis]
MRELAREIAYRPLFLPLLMIVGAIMGSACEGLSLLPILLFSLFLALFYYALLVWFKLKPRPLIFLGLVLFSLLLAGLTAQKIDSRQARFLTLKPQLAKNSTVNTTGSQKILGRVTTFPKGSFRGWRMRITPLTGALVGAGDILLYLPLVAYDDPCLPRIGDIVAVTVKLDPLHLARHPFLRGSLRAKILSGLVASARLENFNNLTITARFSGGLGAVEKLRRSLYRTLFESAGGQEAAAILLAVLIGCRDQLQFKVKELFLDFGVYHLFAISGLHLSIVVGLFFFFVQRLLPGFLRGRLATGSVFFAAGLTLLFLPFYLLLAGLHLPVVRAGIMAAFFLVALLFGRLRDSFSALLGAAIVILFCWPQALFELSFQLSFSAVAAILWVLPRSFKWWEEGLSPHCQKLPTWLQTFLKNIFYLLASSSAITLMTAPWLINRVHFISSYSLAANLLLLPLFSLIIIPFGMLSLLFAPLPGLMSLMLKPLVWGLEALLAGGLFLQVQLPGRRCYFSTLTTWEMILTALSVLTVGWLLAYPRYKKSGFLLLFGLFCAALLNQGCWWHEQERENLALAAFVGGKPQSLLFELPGGEALLINGGSWTGSADDLSSGLSFSMAKNVIAPYCWRRKIKRIDTIILTEPQRGLVGGLLFLVEHFKVREIWYHGIWSGYPPFSNFCRISQKRFGVRWRKISSLSFPFSLNGVEISVLGPPANDFKFLPSRKESILAMAPSLLLRYGELSALVWGGGQLDPTCLPERVNLLALLVAPDKRLPDILTDVAIKSGGWYLEPGKWGDADDKKRASNWSTVHSWRVRNDGFLFLEGDLSGTISDKLPASLISGCQRGLE